jgi:hypothetical protein
MSSPDEAALSNPFPIVRTVVVMMRDYDRCRFQYPRQDGREPPPPALDFLRPDTRQEALRSAAETLRDWRNAGRPCLTPQRIKSAYQNLIATPAFIDKYIKEQE